MLRAGRWGRDFPHLSRPALWPTQPPCTMGTGSFPGVKSGRGVTLTPHPFLVPMVMKEYSYTQTPPMGRTACTEPQCLYKGALYPYLPKFLFRIQVEDIKILFSQIREVFTRTDERVSTLRHKMRKTGKYSVSWLSCFHCVPFLSY